MKTLYDLLGIEHQATLAQIEQGYRHSLDAYLAQQGTTKPEEDQQLRAIAEAYRLLSSPTRRRAYDDKLNRQFKRRPDALEFDGESRALPWVMLLLVIAFLALAGGYYYGKFERNKDRARLEADRAQVEAARHVTAGHEGAQPEQVRQAAPQLSAQHRSTGTHISQ
jgi:curved DNA-binding protein CbpA